MWLTALFLSGLLPKKGLLIVVTVLSDFGFGEATLWDVVAEAIGGGPVFDETAA